MTKMITCLWFDRGEAREAAEFYASVFPDSHVGKAHASAVDIPSAKVGEDLTVEFTVLGQAYIGLNGGPNFKPNEAVSFMVLTENQEETDRYWNAIVGNGGQESACGWCKDRWGFSWQITPRALLDATTDPDRGREAGHGSDDDDEEDRHRDDRGRTARRRLRAAFQGRAETRPVPRSDHRTGSIPTKVAASRTAASSSVRSSVSLVFASMPAGPISASLIAA